MKKSKRSHYLILLVLIWMPVMIFAQSKLIESSLLLDDFNYLIDKIEEIHPDPYRNISDKDLKESFQIIREKLGKSELSRIDFWKLIAPLVTNLKDGHTELNLPKIDMLKNKKETIYFPGEIIIDENKIIQIKSYSENIQIEKPTEIISINNIPSSEILSTFRKYVSTELVSFQNIQIARRFKSYLVIFYGPSKLYNVEYSNGIEKKHVKLGAISNENLEELNPKKDASYSLQFKDDIAILKVNTFVGSLGKFKKFLKNSFKLIADSKSCKLTIDIRENGGGDSRFGDALINYLYNDKYKQVDSLSIKSSKEMRSHFRKNYFGWKYYLIYPLFYINPVTRATFTKRRHNLFMHEFKEKKPRNYPKFKGEIYLFIGPKTYSSAHIFANTFNCYKMGLSIGSPTGGISTFFGDIVEINLPNTGIICDISFKEFYLPCSPYSNDGVQPDILVKNNPFTIKDEVLESINKEIKYK